MCNTSHPAFNIKSDNLHIIFQDTLNLSKALEILKRDYNCDSITIQSGETVNSLFLHDKLFDYVDIIIAPALIGGKDTPTLIDGNSNNTLNIIGVLKLEHCNVLTNSYIHLRYKVMK